MRTKYLVIDNEGQIVDGRFYDHEDVIGVLPFCKAGTEVWSLDFEGKLCGRPTMANLTSHAIKDAHSERAWTRAEIEGSPLLSSYIELPLSRAEQRADDEDNRRFEE